MKLKDVLREYDEQSLYFYARDLGIQAANKIAMEELYEKMVETILLQHHIENRLSILDDETYRVFMQVFRDEEVREEDNLRLERLLDYDLVAFEGDELFVVEEVKDIFLRCHNDSFFQQQRLQKVWLLQCQQVLMHYWGECSIEQFCKVLLLKDCFVEDVDIQALLQQLPVGEVQIAIKENQVYWRSLLNSSMLKEYRKSQKRFEYYLPTVEEIEMLYEYDYDIQQEGIQRLKTILLTKELEEDDVDQLLHEVWNDLSYGLDYEGIYARCLEKTGLTSAELPLSFIKDIDKNCRKFIYRGHTYLETINRTIGHMDHVEY
ncbi:hypothetical protein [uncultured Solobacterium sp.]|uniref:hypothetical protein n=1 Tax=uncultured Solobacterium sp. TaxID=747375 RepID=UPI0028DCDFD0|nr:hypothetical protein [uncultured Solobacterium sp.]